jgi:hypothetical protein
MKKEFSSFHADDRNSYRSDGVAVVHHMKDQQHAAGAKVKCQRRHGEQRAVISASFTNEGSINDAILDPVADQAYRWPFPRGQNGMPSTSPATMPQEVL